MEKKTTNSTCTNTKPVTSIYNQYIDSILVFARKHNIPEKVYQKTRNMATDIALKMREYSDLMVGKGSISSVSILLPHLRLMENLRRNNPEKYKQLVFFATIYPSLSYDERQKQIVNFFQEF